MTKYKLTYDEARIIVMSLIRKGIHRSKQLY